MKKYLPFAVAGSVSFIASCNAPPPPQPQSGAPAPAVTAADTNHATAAEPTGTPPVVSGAQTPRSSICPAENYVSPPVAASEAKLNKDGFVFVEGPVWSDQLGALLFSEMDFSADGSNGPPSKIHLLTPAGQLFTFLQASGSNGLAIDEQGLVAATHDNQAISRIDLATKQRSLLVASIHGNKFNSPNDLVISSSGHIYFTDPDWQLGRRPNQTGVTGVYWVKPDKSVTLVDGKLEKPNGVALSPDDNTLYVGSVDGTVWAYAVKDGKPENRREFAKVDGPDGMAMDCAGNLYVTSHGAGEVHVFDPKAKQLATIQVAPKTTNAAFGGPDRKTLYITAGSGVYSVPTLVPGYPY